MNKFQFKRMLLDLLLANGEDFLNKNPKLGEQWDEEYDEDLSLEENLDKFFNVSESFDSVDPRQFVSYMNAIQSGNDPQTPIFDAYKTYRNPEDIRSDFNNAKNVYPHEIMGYKEEEFYNPSHPNYWGGQDGMKIFKNEDGSQDLTRGFLKKMVDNNMQTTEFIKMLSEEQHKRDLERIWDFDDKRNYEGDLLGSGDGLLDKAWRKLTKFSANNYWGNTVNDYKSGEALNDPNYGIGGLNTFDVFSNVGDGVTSLVTPFGGASKVIKGIGIANDLVQPVAREVYESDHYNRDFDPTNVFKEGAIRLAPQAISLTPNIPGKIGETTKKVDDYVFGNQKVDDNWNVFGKKSEQAIGEQSTKPMYNPDDVFMHDELGKPINSVETISDLREVRNPSNWESLPSDEGMLVKNKLGSDIDEMNNYLNMRKDGIELTGEDIIRIRELAKQYPEFNAKYFGKDMTKGQKVANVGAKALIDNGKKAYARNEPQKLDASKMGSTIEDYNTISKAYNDILKRKPEAVYNATHYNGAGEGLTQYEKDIIAKYLSLNLYYGNQGLNVFK